MLRSCFLRAIMQNMKRRKIVVGFDFDGVIAYNPFRIIRAPVAFVKRNFLGIKKLTFIYPQYGWQQLLWKIAHDSSVFPAKGVDILREFTETGIIESHLITARYSFLNDHLYKWLEKNNLRTIFKTININKKNEQPHLFKNKIILKHKLDYFIEDNLDIVKYLHGKTQTKIYWIYNILDRFHPHPYKFPYLEKALQDILQETR